jgi:gamma-glutamyltranspeptidase/glutathione hydrolase
MVVAPEPLAAEVGLKVFRSGGNAIDAAIAVAFAQGVVNPQSCGIGGVGSMQIYHAHTGREVVIQFEGSVGSKASPTMWQDDFLGQAVLAGRYTVQGNVNSLGYQSIAVPGFVAGMHEAWTRFGTLSWQELIAPSIQYAEEGFRVYPYIEGIAIWPLNKSAYVDGLTILSTTEACAEVYTKQGKLYEVGDVLIQRDMGQTYRQIADQGPRVFYEGELADRIVADFEANGALITRDDLQNYQVHVREPVVGSYRDYVVSSAPPPSSGFQLIEMLNIVEGFDLEALGLNSPAYIEIMAEAMKIGFADKQTHLGDPAAVEIPLGRLLSKEYAAEQRARIKQGERARVRLVRREKHTTEGPGSMGGTTHLSAVDCQGNAVSMTHSLGSSSGVVTPGLGFLYNNWMSQYCPVPWVTPNTIEPGRRRATGCGASVIFKEGKPFIIIGSPGGNFILTSLLQTVVNVIDHDMGIQEAVDAPRFHCEGAAITMEARIPSVTGKAVTAKGYEVKTSVYSYGKMFGFVQAILIDPSTGRIRAGADPRGGGGVAYWPGP